MILFNLLLWLFPRSFRRDFGEEMRRLFADQRQDARRQGLRASAAFWLRTLGGMTAAAWREHREGRATVRPGLPLGDTLLTDLRLTIRMLLARPVFSAVVIAAISLGVGGVATIFSGLNALVLRPLPGVSGGDRLVLIDRRTPDFSEGASASVRFYEHLRESTRSLSGVAVWSRVPLTIVLGQDAYGLAGNIVSTNYFDVLGVRPAAGRFFETGSNLHTTEPSIVLSHATWTSHFDGDHAVVGRSIQVNGRPYRIIGVAPAGFRGVFTPLKIDAWVALAAQPHVHPNRDLADQPWLWTFGRLQPGIESSQARSELSTLTAGWIAAGSDGFTRYSSIRLTPLTGLPDDARRALFGFGAVLLGAAILVLIIAAANVSTLLAMRATARRREMGIRTALGAGRGRLVRQLLTETLTLFVAGGFGGTLLAMAGTSALERLPIPADQGLSLELSPDVRVLIFALAVSLGVGLLFGILPALRSASRSPVTLLRTSSAGGGRRTFTSSALVVAQIACSLVLLTIAGLFVRAVNAGASIDPGFDARHVALAAFDTRSYGYDEDRGRAFYRALRHRLEATEGVESVTYADRVPLTMSSSGTTVTVEGSGADSTQRIRMRAEVGSVDTRYFETLGIRLLTGREFVATDSPGSNAVAIVNETFARRAWPNSSPADAVGRTYVSDNQPVRIVGVAADSKYSMLDEASTPFIYRPHAQQWGTNQTLFLRMNGGEAAAAQAVQEAVASIDPLLPRPSVTTLTRETSVALLPQRVAAMVTGVLGIAGLVLAAIGLYGLVSYGVTLRLREIGVRLALGASREDVVRMVLAQGLRLTAAGILLGLAASTFATRLVESYLLNVNAMDPVSFTGGMVLLLSVALVAAAVPARRAASADPLTVLRTE
ncbi:MAG TPA: ABC transporter permease [Vicinamibacterales bacterium]